MLVLATALRIGSRPQSWATAGMGRAEAKSSLVSLSVF